MSDQPITDEQRIWWRNVLSRHAILTAHEQAILAYEARLRVAEAALCALANGDTPAPDASGNAHTAASYARKLEARIRDLEVAIRWALGEGDSDFGDAVPVDAPRYWWRKELRRRAALLPPSTGGTPDTGRCEGRYPVPMPRDEPFIVSYRCGGCKGHRGPHGPDTGRAE